MPCQNTAGDNERWQKQKKKKLKHLISAHPNAPSSPAMAKPRNVPTA